MGKRIIYVPPSSEKIDDFAKKVCEGLGDTRPEIVRGFAGFMKVVAKSVARSLNEGQNSNDDKDKSNG